MTTIYECPKCGWTLRPVKGFDLDGELNVAEIEAHDKDHRWRGDSVVQQQTA